MAAGPDSTARFNRSSTARSYPTAKVRRALTTVRRQGALLKDAAFEVIVTTTQAEESEMSLDVSSTVAAEKSRGRRRGQTTTTTTKEGGKIGERSALILMRGLPLLLQRPGLVAHFIGVEGEHFRALAKKSCRSCCSAGTEEEEENDAAFHLDLESGTLTATRPELRVAFIAALRAAESDLFSTTRTGASGSRVKSAVAGDAEGEEVEPALRPFGSPHPVCTLSFGPGR